MLDFMNKEESSEGIKIDEIFNLFRTESFEFNDKLFQTLQKYPTTKILINKYLKVDIKNIFNIFNKISMSSSEIIKEENINDLFSEIEVHIYRISKIIFLFHLIQESNHLLLNTIKNTKKYLEGLKTNENLFLKEKINTFINDLTNSSNYINDLISSLKIIFKRSFSRRSTNDITNSSISMIGGSQEKDQNNNEKINNNNIIRVLTPRFKDSEIPERKNSLKDESGSKCSIKIDSSMTLQKMNFVQYEDKNENNNNKNVKIYKSNKIKHKSCDLHSTYNIRNRTKNQLTKVKESLFTKRRKISVNSSEDEINNNQNERIKILAEILDTINLLYKEKTINANQKINIKQIIISNPKTVIDKYNKNYNNMDKKSDKNLLYFNIKSFLLKEFDIL